jgi:hypothetical protein
MSSTPVPGTTRNQTRFGVRATGSILRAVA